MVDTSYKLGLYLHLARASQLRRSPWARDKLLLLAAVIAADNGLAPVAACCRSKILANNPGHLIGRFDTVALALEDEQFVGRVKQLARTYPPERAEEMLRRLGIDMAQEGATYQGAYEYAAALLGTTTEQLEANYGRVGQQHVNPFAAPQSESDQAAKQRFGRGPPSPLGNIMVVVVLPVLITLVGVLLAVLLPMLLR